MIISELKIYNFRRFQSVDGAPGLQITFHKGLNALIGENDSGKTAVIDALKLVLLTQSNEYIRPVDEDFYTSANGEACTEFRIDCFITEFSQNEAKNFVEYLKFRADGEKVEYTLELHYRAWREGHKIYQELRVGDADDGISIDGKARDLLKAVYLKPLRDAEREMSSGRSSRISQILLNHPVFKDKNEHTVLGIFQDANQKIEEYFTNDPEGKSILQTIRDNLEAFNDKGQKSDAELKTSDIQIKAILESLSLKAPELNPGLGELNLLFIAAELLLLKDDTDGGLKLALIEELEAHLHPQAQLRLISYLQNEYNENDVQIIVSTHSPILASKINLKNLILMKDGKGFDLAEGATGLQKGDYLFLQRFLDSTKANLFFAKGIIMVEGDAENILIPVIADIIGYPLEKYGVSIVNVGSTAFLRYSGILIRKNGEKIGIPVSVITDCDVRPYDIDEKTKEKQFNEKVSESLQAEQAKNEKYSNGSVRGFTSPRWTLEYCIAMPYLRNITGHNVQVIDDLPYVRQMLKRIYDEKKYEKLKYVIRNSYLSNKQFADIQTFVQALYLRDDGSLCVGNQKKALAGAGKPSTQQFNILIEDLLMKDGIIRFHDAYSYAQKAIDTLSETYTDLFPLRFRYVFIDEYQDCDIIQRKALMKIFDSEKCSVMNIGDPDQAIYNSSNSKVPDWDPRDGFLPIQTSCRYSQEIADAICKLKTGNKEILTFTGNTGIKPVLIVFDPKKIDRVLGGFISALETHGLHDCQGIYKAVGAVRKDTGAGLKIGSYWSEFDSFPKKQGDYNYWELVEQIKTCLLAGDLYKAECIVRKLLCRLFHYAKIVNADSGKEYTVYTIKKTLNEEYRDIYRQWIFDLSRLQNLNTENVDSFLRKEVNELLKIRNPQAVDVFEGLPEFFLDRTDFRTEKEACERNVFVDPIRGRRIMFDTIHGVKGETHDATLYLETDRQGASDLNRILPYFGTGKVGTSPLYDYSRKLAYVGMSRPRKLLCVAMQDKTYKKCEDKFVADWEIIDLRE